jgi:hypothetical protein
VAFRCGGWSFGSSSASSRVETSGRPFSPKANVLSLHLPLLAALLSAAPADQEAPSPEAAEAGAAEASLAWSDFAGLPIFMPMDPLEYERSALFAPPVLLPKCSWSLSVHLDYASQISLYNNVPNSVLLDAEVGHLSFTSTFRLNSTVFLYIEGGVQGAYAGFLDGLLNAYHSLFGISYTARALRPLNKFAYYFESGTDRQTFKPVGLTPLDTQLGVGWMLNQELQLLTVLVVPTAFKDGYAAHTVQFATILTWQRPLFWDWLLFQGTLGFGATPRAGGGLLQPYQNVVFGSASVGLRPRLSQSNFLYVNFFLQSPIYRHTGDLPLDGLDGSLDFGWMYRTDDHWEFLAGLTENPIVNGPAPDVVFRFGLRHGF